jgi:hypothetical protein
MWVEKSVGFQKSGEGLAKESRGDESREDGCH